jgi:hypothetical protein
MRTAHFSSPVVRWSHGLSFLISALLRRTPLVECNVGIDIAYNGCGVIIHSWCRWPTRVVAEDSDDTPQYLTNGSVFQKTPAIRHHRATYKGSSMSIHHPSNEINRESEMQKDQCSCGEFDLLAKCQIRVLRLLAKAVAADLQQQLGIQSESAGRISPGPGP